MKVEVLSKVDIPVNKIVDNFMDHVEHSEEIAAEAGARFARRFFMQHYRGLRANQNTEHVKDSFKAMKSNYRGGGWIYGVLSSNRKNRWGYTMGTRAHFFEYGNSRQPARPYMAPSLHAVRRAFKLQLDRDLAGAARESNRLTK